MWNPRWPVDSHHKGPVMRKAFPCQGVIMVTEHPSPPENDWQCYISYGANEIYIGNSGPAVLKWYSKYG